MAAKIGVLEIGQTLDSTPKTFISKSHAKLLLCRLEAEKVGDRLIRRLKIFAASAVKAMQSACKPFIPEKLPSHKLPGTHVSGPMAETYANCRACIRVANQIARTSKVNS